MFGIKSDETTRPKKKKWIGLRNIVTTRERWAYLIFYDIDRQEKGVIQRMLDILDNYSAGSYVMYKTKHGIHLVGLTPLTIIEYAKIFDILQDNYPSYYSGQTIRMSRKSDEKQELVDFSFGQPMIERLYRIYLKRFPELVTAYIPPNPFTKEEYFCVFEKYWSND